MRIAFVTCLSLPEPDHDEPIFLAAAQAAGHQATMAAWDDPAIPWADYDRIILRSCWDYPGRVDEFRAWLARIAPLGTLQNPADMVAGNLDKRYLQDLERHGLPVVPTRWAERGAALHLPDLTQGWPQFVLKPAISAGSELTRLFRQDQADEAQAFAHQILAQRPLMVQPFFPSVRTVGERSIVCLGGVPSHVVIKMPRFDEDDESVTGPDTATPAETELWQRVLATLPQTPLYARLDLMEDAQGQWCISELELIEPSLFFFKHPPAAARFIELIAAE